MGFAAGGELRDAIAAGTAYVVERPGGICGYASGFGYGWHAVAETNEHLIALISSAQAFMGLGILVPTRNTELLQWCLAHGRSHTEADNRRVRVPHHRPPDRFRLPQVPARSARPHEALPRKRPASPTS